MLRPYPAIVSTKQLPPFFRKIHTLFFLKKGVFILKKNANPYLQDQHFCLEIVTILNGYIAFNYRMTLIVNELKVFKLKVVNIFHFGVNFHLWQRIRFS